MNCCVFILNALNILKFEEIRVNLWTVKMKFFSTYRNLKYSTFQLCSNSPKDANQQIWHPLEFNYLKIIFCSYKSWIQWKLALGPPQMWPPCYLASTLWPNESSCRDFFYLNLNPLNQPSHKYGHIFLAPIDCHLASWNNSWYNNNSWLVGIILFYRFAFI